MSIKSIAIIGMGALGLLYGDLLQADSSLSVGFITDAQRRERYEKQPISVNGTPKSFRYLSAEVPEGIADLVIFAVKDTALEQAMADAAGYIGERTVLLSLLNGITSERRLEARFGGADRVVYCVAQGMDAVRDGRALTYSRCGALNIGQPEGRSPEALEAVRAALAQAGVPHVVDADILHRLWSKFMLNVGVNQVVMVCEGAYATVQRPGPARDRMIAAMREVMALSELEGVPVGEDDLKFYVDLMDTLAPEGMPSMRQDGLARRKSEVELFSGTVCRLAAAHGLAVPVNEALYREITQIEAAY